MTTYMRHFVTAALFMAVPVPSWRHVAAAGEPVGDDVRAVARATNAFAFDLYRQLRASSSGNLFCSPTSISTALAMTYAGAAGDTAREMNAVLHFDELPAEQVHAAFASLMALFDTPEESKYQLRIANRLWGQQNYGFLPQFLTVTGRDYGAELAQVDFVGQTERTRQTINEWVERQTNDRIRDLLPSGSLSNLTRLVLTNAIYFKGQWEHAFAAEATRDAPFHASASRTVDVPLMYQEERFLYGKTDDLQILEMAYVGDHLSMLILLPRELDGLPALEQSLTAEHVAQLTSRMRKQKVNVHLPRFRLTEKLMLKSVLSALGMPSAFEPDRADFSAMNGNRDLFVSEAIHQAFVDVNEEGTEAAAATGVIVGITSVPLEPEVFRADRPFVFLIRDNRSGGILFLGRLVDPKP
jgi:serpin B